MRDRFFSYINRIYCRVMVITDWFMVPLVNELLNFYVRKAPRRFFLRLDAAIDKGLSYFEKQEALTLDAAVTFFMIINRSFEPRLARLEDKVRSYAKAWNDPHLRLLDETYDPHQCTSSTAKPVDIDALYGVEKPLVKCLYADQMEEDTKLLEELEFLDDGGGYGTTHKMLGCIILKKFSRISHERLNNIIESAIPLIADSQRHAGAGDIFSERTVLLQWLGYHDMVRPAWIVRIMRDQMQDGGWRWTRALWSKTEQHPSCLGLTALIQYREKIGRQYAVSMACPSEMGRAFPITTTTSEMGGQERHQ